MAKSAPIDVLPDGVLLEVFGFCPLGSLAAGGSCSRRFAGLAAEDGTFVRAVGSAFPFLARARLRPLTQTEVTNTGDLGLGSFDSLEAASRESLQGLFAGTHTVRVQVLDRHLNQGNRFSAYDALLTRAAKGWLVAYMRDRPEHRSPLVAVETVPADRLRPVPPNAPYPRLTAGCPPALRAGELVEMQYRFAPTSAFGWWLGHVQHVSKQTAKVAFTHFGPGSKWACETVDLESGVQRKPNGHATGGLRYPSEHERRRWEERQTYWRARGLGYDGQLAHLEQRFLEADI